jgi:hypothetical protein
MVDPPIYGDTGRRVNLVFDACDGLLCPYDVSSNLKKCRDGAVVAPDFRATGFFPPAVAMGKPVGNFAWKVAKLVSYPRSSDVEAMVAASHFLVPYGRKDIGQPDGFSFYLDWFHDWTGIPRSPGEASDPNALPSSYSNLLSPYIYHLIRIFQL